VPLGGFKPASPAKDWPQICSLDHAATGISLLNITVGKSTSLWQYKHAHVKSKLTVWKISTLKTHMEETIY